MNFARNYNYESQVKQEYLPPPLEKNYLSLFDVHVKATKQTLNGTEEQRMALIKKRIKKFFDYGNQSTQTSFSQNQFGQRHYVPPSEINMKDIRKNLEIICSQIILYGKGPASFEKAQKMLPGFVGYEKIDDCNVKLSFPNQKMCKSLLMEKTQNQSALTTQSINHPLEIGNFFIKKEWFEIIFEDEDPYELDPFPESFYARYVTNKDDILISNDNYFRKLLGKARTEVEKKEQQERLRQKELQEKAERKKAWAKKKFIAKFHHRGEKNNSRDDDTITNYDGFYEQKSSINSDDSLESYEYNPRKNRQSYARKFYQRPNKYFQSLDISQIRQTPIELEERTAKKHSLSRNHSPLRQELSFDVFSRPQEKKQKFFSSREMLIKAYRQKQAKIQENKKKQLDSYDFDKDFNSKVQKQVAKGKKAIIYID